MRKFVVGVITLAVVLAGCATIMHGTSEQVGINSVPDGAKVMVDNTPLGNTPVVAHLSRKDNHVIKISLAGYQPVDMTVTRHVSGWVAGNIIFGGLIGLAVDAIDGGMYKLTPAQVNASLHREGSDVQLKNNAIYVGVVLRPDPNWQRIGTLSRTR